MFSWMSAAKPAAAQETEQPPPPQSYDPLKGQKGAVAFYQHHASVQQPSAESAPSVAPGSAAHFYHYRVHAGNSRQQQQDGVQQQINEEAEVEQEEEEQEEEEVCPGVGRLNHALRLGKQALVDAAVGPDSGGNPVTVVVGSDVADLEATAACIVYAYALRESDYADGSSDTPATSTGSSRGAGNVSSRGASDVSGRPRSAASAVVPVLCVSREEFRLRTEAVWLLRSMGVDVDALMFVDEVDLRQLHEWRRLQLVLVGLSDVPQQLQGLQAAVHEVLPGPMRSALASEVAPVMDDDAYSMCAILAKKLSEEKAHIFLNVALCRLLLAAVLLTTFNLDAQQSSAVDGTMAAFLLQGAREEGRNGLYNQLRDRKYNEKELTTDELLRADYVQRQMGPGTRGKRGGEVLNVGVANVGLSLSDTVAKDPHFAANLQSFSERRSLHALILLPTYCSAADERLRREVAIVSVGLPALVAGLSFFLQQERHGLRMQPVSVKGLPTYAKAYSLGNTAVTRPLVEKILREYFDDGR